MKNKLILFCFFIGITCFAQEEIKIDSTQTLYVSQSLDSLTINTKNPMKAALYSAVLPGLGQVYNDRYWKAPIVWGLIGTGVGMTLFYNKKYNEYHTAFLAEINGEPHKFSGIYTAEVLAEAQNYQTRNKNYAIAGTILAYILNILDATVDAHLYEIRRDKDLQINPTTLYDPTTGEQSMGIALKFNLP